MTSFLIIHNCIFCNKKLNWNDVWSVTNLTGVFLVLTEQDSEKVALKMTLLACLVAICYKGVSVMLSVNIILLLPLFCVMDYSQNNCVNSNPACMEQIS